MAFKVKMSGDDLNPGNWFPFNGTKTVEEVGGVCLRVLNRKMLRQIEKEINTRHSEFRIPEGAPPGTPAQRIEWTEVNTELEDELTWDYCIVDWKDVLDENDQPIPCTKENKVRLMQENLAFLAFVREKQIELRTQLLKAEEERKKN